MCGRLTRRRALPLFERPLNAGAFYSTLGLIPSCALRIRLRGDAQNATILNSWASAVLYLRL
jgi:hypothetical protein